MYRFTKSGRRESERGQVIVLFALMFIAATAMVGLVLDGGATFAVRRDAQAAADMAAMAGANSYLSDSSSPNAIAVAKAIATANGFTNAVGGDTVAVTLTTSPALAVKVDISTPHQNAFARVIPGQEVWTVSVTATASAGVPDTAVGPLPMQFSYRVFNSDGSILTKYTKTGCATAVGRDVLGGCPFGESNNSTPDGADDIAWTVYGDPENANTNDIRDYIQAMPGAPVTKTINLNDNIDQHNNGFHTPAFGDIQTYLAGNQYPAPVVDDNGNFVGWATFHVTSAAGASDKRVYGYFMGPWKSSSLTITNCAGGTCPNYLGSYILKLTN